MRAYSPGIRFNDSFFTEPVRLADWTPPRVPALFVVLAADSNWAPKPFQPLYFGELGNNARVHFEQSEYTWMVQAWRDLFVSVCPMPFSTSAQRSAARDELIAGYNPGFQAHHALPQADLAYRIDEMEKRHQEHTAHMLQMLGSIHKHFEPQPVPARRRIGFQPETPGAGVPPDSAHERRA